jgi:DNA-binding NtrC family response regulator
MSTNNTRVLVVDDEENIRKFLQMQLDENGYHAEVAADGERAMELITTRMYDLVILDYNLPGQNGIEVLKRIRLLGPRPAVIIITAYGAIEMAVEAMKAGANDYLTKPFDFEEIHLVIQKTEKLLQLENRVEVLEKIKQSDSFAEMIGHSSAIRNVYAQIKKVASSLITSVLITGESGTGKELVARAIHNLSNRADKPFIALNCSTIHENLLESELFGHEKGSFTDARSTHRGMFEVAQGGTIFLDEIGDLPLNLQSKLLRTLQEKVIRRIGGHASIPVDVRIISATNKDIDTAIREKKFREDLYYRINVVPIRVPPLRDRKEDILLLANHFIDNYARELGKNPPLLTGAARESLENYSFPGNVRELRNISERLILLEDSPVISVEQLPQEVRGIVEVTKHTDDEIIHEFQYAKRQWVTIFEREYLVKLLSRHSGNVTHAARDAGMERSALQRFMRKYNLISSEFKKTRD